ncbi:MAG: hypothetical protein Q7U14_14915 [Lacisediminimonas sp.]|nr:hypothetical protein [Lacisediminimonas sp.]
MDQFVAVDAAFGGVDVLEVDARAKRQPVAGGGRLASQGGGLANDHIGLRCERCSTGNHTNEFSQEFFDAHDWSGWRDGSAISTESIRHIQRAFEVFIFDRKVLCERKIFL